MQGLAIYFGSQFVMGKLFPGTPPTTVTTTDATGQSISVPANNLPVPPFEARPDRLNDGASYNPIPQRIVPIWPISPLDVVIVVSPTFVIDPLSKVPDERVVFKEKNFDLGNSKDKRTIDTSFKVPKAVQNNGTLWGHFYIGLAGSKLDPADSGFDSARAFHFAHPLTQYIAQKKVVKTKNLLKATKEDEVEEEEEIPATSGPIITSHYHPNLTLQFVPDSGEMGYPNLHPAVRLYVKMEATGARDATGQNGWYYPLLYINTFWQLKSHMTVINSTVTELPMHIDLYNLAYWKFNVLSSLDEGAKITSRNAAEGIKNPAGGDGNEFEMIKQVLLDTNIYLLATTVIVSVFHMIFEMLAFKSDISHYRNKKNNVGISVRSILSSVFMQAVIFLYLLDNNENTSK